MQFNEKFSNTQIDESVKGEAIKQGAKKAAKYARVMGKKAINKTKKYLKKPTTKGAVVGAGLTGWATRGIVDRKAYGDHIKKNYIRKDKNESLIEKLDRVNANLKVTNEINLAAAGKALGGAGKSAFSGAKEVATNVGNTAKTVGGAIAKHPVRTAAIAGGVGAGYLGYKGAKKAIGGAKKAGKAAYSDWKV